MDLKYISIIVPKVASDDPFLKISISFIECEVQSFFISVLGGAEWLLLASMAMVVMFLFFPLYYPIHTSLCSDEAGSWKIGFTNTFSCTVYTLHIYIAKPEPSTMSTMISWSCQIW